MFYLVERNESVLIAPKHFNSAIRDDVMTQLRSQLEGKASGDYGLTVLVTTIVSLSEGILRDFTGDAEFKVRYISLIFRPYPNQVIYAVVQAVGENGFTAESGPINIFVGKASMAEDYVLKKEESGSYFATEDGELRVAIGTIVRLRILNLRFSQSSDNAVFG